MDEVTIFVTAGKGGSGSVSFFANRKGPCGGKGGKGGDVILRASDSLNNLNFFMRKRQFAADEGNRGSTNNLSGKNGTDLIIQLPVHTECTILGKVYTLLPNTQFTVLKGGKGGLGNGSFKTSCHQTPVTAQPGLPGEGGMDVELKLQLKLSADIGFIGAPNAGKSSLLQALTNSSSEIGAYAFTTTRPFQGVCEGVCLLDLPGIIKNAAQNKGLGLQFLKHAEGCRALVMVVDITNNPIECIEMLQNEIAQYGKLTQPEYLVLNKIDQMKKDAIHNIYMQVKPRFKHVFLISAALDIGLNKFKEYLPQLAQKQKDNLSELAQSEKSNVHESTEKEINDDVVMV